MLWICLLATFVLGAVVGSFLNVCIERLPLEKTPLWPRSRCSSCLQQIRWYDNIPLLSWLVLGGRCRTCGARFSSRYFAVELITAVCFCGLFWLEIVQNTLGVPALQGEDARMLRGIPPSFGAIALFGHHATLVSFLLVATFCDLDCREIPLGITIPGTLIGLAGSVLWPWPWPNPPNLGGMPTEQPWWLIMLQPVPGVYAWPVWGPLPHWLPPGSWQLGLATGSVGLLGGTLLLRAMRILFTRGLGVEAMGLGDADLMMMAGAFLGWQPVVVAFFVSALPGLLFALANLLVQAIQARRQLRLGVEAIGKTGDFALVLEGNKIAMADLPGALAALAAKTGRRELLIDPYGLEIVFDQQSEAIGEAAQEARLTRIEHLNQRVPADLVFGIFRLLFRRLLSRPNRTIKVEALQQDGTAMFRVDGTMVAPAELAEALRIRASEPDQTLLQVDTSALEQWFQARISAFKQIATQAGLGRARVWERGIPFGPALAAATVVTMLCWRTLGPIVQPLFFNGVLLALMAGAGGALMFILAYGLRLIRLARG